MKAILILELDGMPDICDKCLAFYDDDRDGYWCHASDKQIPWLWKDDTSADQYCPRPDWCPLKEMPERFPDDPEGQWAYDVGWNQCLDAIEGTED